MNADLTTRYLDRYLQGEDPDQALQTAMQAFRQEAEKTCTLSQQQTAFEETATDVIEEMRPCAPLKAQEQRLKELQLQAALLKKLQEEQQRALAEKNAQLKAQTEQLVQSQAALEQLSARAAVPRSSPYEDRVTAFQVKLTAYLRDQHASH